MALIFIATMFFPVIMLPFNIFLYSTEKKQKVVIAFLIAFGLAALAYNFQPLVYQNTDILRHWNHMRRANSMTFEMASKSNFFSGLMGYFTILKIFSYAESKYLLQAFITLMGYYFCIFVIAKMDDCRDNSVSFLTLFIFLSCTFFLGFCSGIRQYTVFAIFVITFYVETVKGKFQKWAWVVYILLTTIHTSAGFLIFLRIVCGLFSYVKNVGYLSVLMSFWGFAQNKVISFLVHNFSGNPYIDKVIELSGFYEENPSKFIVPSYIWRFAFLLFCTFVVIFLLKKYDDRDPVPKKYLYFAITSCMFTFGGLTSYDLFSRFTMFCFMIIIPLLPEFFKKIGEESGFILYLGLLLFSVLVLIYNVGQYLTFNFSSIFEILTTNVLTFIGAI